MITLDTAASFLKLIASYIHKMLHYIYVSPTHSIPYFSRITEEKPFSEQREKMDMTAS